MTLTDPLIPIRSFEDDFRPRPSIDGTDSGFVRWAVAGCIAFWLIAAAILYLSL
ncbi:MAG: hypothetical protein WDM86_19865 [Rhizomicrobium sp.]